MAKRGRPKYVSKSGDLSKKPGRSVSEPGAVPAKSKKITAVSTTQIVPREAIPPKSPAMAIQQRLAIKSGFAGSGVPFGRPMRRRGRRPKGMQDYQPYQADEEGYGADPHPGALEYDTGIKVKEASGEDDFRVLDRTDDYEEELNFDW